MSVAKRVLRMFAGRLLALAPLFAVGADLYVDSEAASSGDGTSWATAKKTIREAVDSAGAGDTVWVRGGAARVYTISNAVDLMTIEADSVTLRSSGGDAKVEIAEDLYTRTNNASVIYIPAAATNVTIAGFDFTYYGNRGEENKGSLANRGRVIDIVGDRATIEDCTFRQVGNYKLKNGEPTYSNTGDKDDSMGHAAVATRARQGATERGRYLKVQRCRFLGESENCSMSATIHGKDSVLSENVFSNCYFIVWPTKNSNTPFLFISNFVWKCKSIQTTYNSYGEWPGAELCYNIFLCASGSALPFIQKNGYYGLNNSKVFIHHNTIVNASQLALITENRTATNKTEWQPQFFDNLILLDPALAGDAAIFQNSQTSFRDANVSSFKTGGAGCLKNNAWYAPGGITSGAATNVAGYDLSAGCAVADNIVLAEWPKFMSLDPNSPDFLRAKESRNPSWAKRGVASTNVAECVAPLCDYIGAVEPYWKTSGISIVLR